MINYTFSLNPAKWTQWTHYLYDIDRRATSLQNFIDNINPNFLLLNYEYVSGAGSLYTYDQLLSGSDSTNDSDSYDEEERHLGILSEEIVVTVDNNGISVQSYILVHASKLRPHTGILNTFSDTVKIVYNELVYRAQKAAEAEDADAWASYIESLDTLPAAFCIISNVRMEVYNAVVQLLAPDETQINRSLAATLNEDLTETSSEDSTEASSDVLLYARESSSYLEGYFNKSNYIINALAASGTYYLFANSVLSSTSQTMTWYFDYKTNATDDYGKSITFSIAPPSTRWLYAAGEEYTYIELEENGRVVYNYNPQVGPSAKNLCSLKGSLWSTNSHLFHDILHVPDNANYIEEIICDETSEQFLRNIDNQAISTHSITTNKAFSGGSWYINYY